VKGASSILVYSSRKIWTLCASEGRELGQRPSAPSRRRAVEGRESALPGRAESAVVGRETAKRTARNPQTGEKVAVKAGAAVRFKASPALKEAAFAGLKKTKRKAAKG
jgi:hypothetical protein